MNKVYKVIWSKVKNAYVVVSELTKSHTKSPKSGVIGRTLVAGVLACVLSTGVIMPVFAAGYTAAGATSADTGSIAMGSGAVAKGNGTLVIGKNAKNKSANSDAIIIGNNASVDAGQVESGMIVIGNGASASGAWAVVIGAHAIVDSLSCGVAIGDSAKGGSYGVSMGWQAETGGESVAIGSISGATGRNASAFGHGAYSPADYGVAIGNMAYVTNQQGIAIGNNSVSTENNVVSFGHKLGDTIANHGVSTNPSTYQQNLYRRIINVADGKAAHEVATVAQTSTTEAGTGITVSSATNTNGSTKYTIAVNANGTVTSGNANPLKGGTVYTEVRPSANGTFVKTANTTATNLSALDTAAKNAIKGLSVNGRIITYTKGDGTTGTITTQDNNTTYAAMTADELNAGTATTSRTMTAKVVGDYVKSKTDDKIKGLSVSGNTLTYTKGNNSTGTVTLPVKSYTSGTGIVIDNDQVSTKNVLMYDADANDKATLAGSKGTTLTNLKAATLSKTSTDAVIGNQLWTTNQNMAGMKTDINMNKGNILSLNSSMTNALESITSMSTLIDTMDDMKADASLNNLNNEGKAIIKAAAADAVQEYMSGRDKIVPMNRVVMNEVIDDDIDAKLAEKASVDYVDDRLSFKADKDDVYVKSQVDAFMNTKADVDNVYSKEESDGLLAEKADKTELEAKADKDASNIDVDAWSSKLGTGAIEEGNTGLVNGGAVFNAIQNISVGNSMVESDRETISIGKNDDAGTISIAKADGSARVITGIEVDPMDASSATNVGYVNNIAQDIVNGVNDGFARMDNRINKAGANAAALANLHPLNDDGDTKWNVAASIGRYHGESAGAFGLFYKPSDRVAVNVSSTIGDSNDTMFGAGVSVALDKPMSNGLSKVQMAQAINNQAQHIEKQDAEIAELKNIVASDRKEIAELKALVRAMTSK